MMSFAANLKLKIAQKNTRKTLWVTVEFPSLVNICSSLRAFHYQYCLGVCKTRCHYVLQVNHELAVISLPRSSKRSTTPPHLCIKHVEVRGQHQCHLYPCPRQGLCLSGTCQLGYAARQHGLPSAGIIIACHCLQLLLKLGFKCLGSNSAPPACMDYFLLSPKPLTSVFTRQKLFLLTLICAGQPHYSIPRSHLSTATGFSLQISVQSLGLSLPRSVKYKHYLALKFMAIQEAGIVGRHSDLSGPVHYSYHCIPAACRRAVPQADLPTSHASLSRPQHDHVRNTRAVLKPS